MRRGLVSLGLAIGLGFAMPAAAAEDAELLRRLSSEDIFALEYASDPRVSPDGRSIAYVRRTNDIMTDRTRSNIWIAAADGSAHRPLLSGAKSYTAPRWSSDGGRLAYLATDENGKTQIHLRWMDTGQTARLTDLTERPRHLTFSPDGRWLAFTMDVPAEPKTLAKSPKKPEGAEWAKPARVIDSVIYRFDGRGFLEPAYTHIFVVPAEGGAARQLTSGNYDHQGPLSFASDGGRIYFASNRNEDWEYERVERDIFAVETGSGALTRITGHAGSERAPTVSPDGNWIAYETAEIRNLAYRTIRVAVMRSDGSDIRVLTPELDREAENIQWAGNDRLYFQYDDRGIRKVASVTLSGRMADHVSGLGGTTLGRPYTSGTYTVSQGGVVAYTAGRADRPADLAVWRRGRDRVLTRLNEDLLAHRDLGRVHEITYASSHDGQEIQGWYVTPPGFDASKKYPLVLELHGGPHSSYGPHFSAEVQRYAAEGYVVFYPNYRGSTSYGEAFALLLQYKYSSPDDFADNMSGIDALIGMGFVDPEQLFITGGSAGGIASAYAIGLTDRFRAAAVAKPVINWISKTLTGDIYTYQIRHQFPGPPWEEFEHYWQRSPLSLVGNVTTPTLLLTGEEDLRTPISETEQFYQALKLRRIDTVMVRIPGAPHGIAGRPSRLIAKVDNILAWFEKYRADGEAD